MDVYWTLLNFLRLSTCEGHLIGDPVDGEHSVSPLIAGLDEELLWGGVSGREEREGVKTAARKGFIRFTFTSGGITGSNTDR